MLRYVVLNYVWREFSLRKTVRKGKSTLIALTNTVDILWILHQNSKSGSFLKVSCNVETDITELIQYIIQLY